MWLAGQTRRTRSTKRAQQGTFKKRDVKERVSGSHKWSSLPGRTKAAQKKGNGTRSNLELHQSALFSITVRHVCVVLLGEEQVPLSHVQQRD